MSEKLMALTGKFYGKLVSIGEYRGFHVGDFIGLPHNPDSIDFQCLMTKDAAVGLAPNIYGEVLEVQIDGGIMTGFCDQPSFTSNNKFVTE